ncbi:MAG: DUF192 domain-containing protein [Elusimicrobiota bacterium]|jgi:hypothetical protein
MAPTRLTAFNKTRAQAVASQVVLADTPWTRAKGLLGRASLAREEGMWIVPCAMIHMIGMRFAIDAVFLDRGLRVLKVSRGLRPWRLSPWVLSAHSVLELSEGAAAGIEPGHVLELR